MRPILVLSVWNLNTYMSGGTRRTVEFLDAIGDRVLLCQPGKPHPQFESISYRPHFGKRRVGINWGIFNFLWPSTKGLVRRLVRERDPEAIVLTSMWNYLALSEFTDIPMVLDSHDVNATAISGRYGEHHLFTRMVRSWERKTAQRMNRISVCSETDRQAFIDMYDIPQDRVIVAPNGVTTSKPADSYGSQLNPFLEDRLGDSTVLLFLGCMTYEPNRVGLKFLSEMVMPSLNAEKPDAFKLLACGGPVPSGPFDPSIIFTGQLPQDALERCIRRSSICLAPIMSGSGTRIKILEYMGMRKPVVATPKGAEGIECANSRDIVIAEPEHFAEAVRALASQPSKAISIANAGFELVKEHYDWDVAVKPIWRKMIDDLLT